jgi:DNA ligase D-like protein (predicted polymerase)
MLLRKNTKAFKTIVEIVSACQSRPDREKLIRLYITKAGTTIKDRINVEGIQGDAALFYEMNYQTVLNSLKSSNHQLHMSDDIPGIYFFHSSSNKEWDETPFEFDEAVKDEFKSLPELPVMRKKGKAQKFALPTPTVKSQAPPVKKQKEKRGGTKQVTEPAKKGIKRAEEKVPKQPDFKLRNKIQFTDLEKVIFRQPQINKRDLLRYYNNISEYLLPYLKDRPLSTRLQSATVRTPVEVSIEALFKNDDDQIPDWLGKGSSPRAKAKKEILTCNDREHLLLYVQAGALEFDPGNSKVKDLSSPDVIVIAIDSPGAEVTKAAEVALTTKQILDGLQLPAFVKTDGASGLHIYIPLDSKNDFETSRTVAEYICKLVALKTPNLVTMKGSAENVYGKVSLDYSANEEGSAVVAPYSLVAGQTPIVATPVRWEELAEGLRVEDFNPESILKRLKQEGDPFENLFKKKINAEALLKRLTENYSFLF